MHHRDAGITDVSGAPDQSLRRGEIIHRRSEYSRDRIHRSGGPTVEHQFRRQVNLFNAFGGRAETERSRDVSGNRAAQCAVNATYTVAGGGERARVMHAFRGFRQWNDANRAVRETGAAFLVT